MFTPPDLHLREFKPSDQREVLAMISHIQVEEEQAELKRQIKNMFVHPALWVISGIIIVFVGLSLE